MVRAIGCKRYFVDKVIYELYKEDLRDRYLTLVDCGKFSYKWLVREGRRFDRKMNRLFKLKRYGGGYEIWYK